MLITETRKAIIELIVPYMNKEVEFWCLLQIVNDYWIDIQQYCYELWLKNFLTTSWLELENSNIYKIIWHYDITAVLKYILDKWYDIDTLKLHMLKWDFSIWEKWKYWRKKGRLPNKPLYLYTEEEDKQLLDLLLKLK